MVSLLFWNGFWSDVFWLESGSISFESMRPLQVVWETCQYSLGYCLDTTPCGMWKPWRTPSWGGGPRYSNFVDMGCATLARQYQPFGLLDSWPTSSCWCQMYGILLWPRSICKFCKQFCPHGLILCSEKHVYSLIAVITHGGLGLLAPHGGPGVHRIAGFESTRQNSPIGVACGWSEGLQEPKDMGV